MSFIATAVSRTTFFCMLILEIESSGPLIIIFCTSLLPDFLLFFIFSNCMTLSSIMKTCISHIKPSHKVKIYYTEVIWEGYLLAQFLDL